MSNEKSYISPFAKIVVISGKRLLCISPSEGGTENITNGESYTDNDFS